MRRIRKSASSRGFVGYLVLAGIGVWVCAVTALALTLGPPWQAAGVGLIVAPLIPWAVARNQKRDEGEMSGTSTSGRRPAGEGDRFNFPAVWVGLVFSVSGILLLVMNSSEGRFLERLEEAMIAYGVLVMILGVCSSFFGRKHKRDQRQ
ncbi:hypothetical protein [Streptomyces sp. NPDC048496]|uniref:hypothetical protein n=1 Tax=Streptomyces sp. NPDC048496 TaxID=3365558 RepID=UPI00371F7148